MSMITIQDVVETDWMDQYLLSYPNRLLLAVDAGWLLTLSDEQRMQWAVKNAVYQYITWQMLAWLGDEIGDMNTIEIGAGNGALGRYLGIPRTDSRLQELVDIKLWYELMNQPTINYAPDVEKFEAMQAIAHYKPSCVIGAFITQYGKDQSVKNSNPFGPKETEILKRVKKYIVFGNKLTHEGKLIFQQPHRELSFPWLFTRCQDQSLNRVWIWDMK